MQKWLPRLLNSIRAAVLIVVLSQYLPWHVQAQPDRRAENSFNVLQRNNQRLLAESPSVLEDMLDGGKVFADLSYVPGSHDPRQMLDLYLPPRGPKSAKRPPLVVWLHSGNWSWGHKGLGPFIPLVRNGFAVASVNYRLTMQASFPAQIFDCKAAIRWLRAHASNYKINTDRIGVWGASSGGHLAALLGTSNDVAALEGNEGSLNYSSSVQAVCDYYGPSDLVVLLQEHGGPQDKTNESLVKFLGGGSNKLAKAASPVTYVNRKAAKFLIVHGELDPLVPLDQSQELYNSLKKAGANVVLHVVDGAGHGTGFGKAQSDMVVDFFKKALM
jgi:acetyl esterase/lipase